MIESNNAFYLFQTRMNEIIIYCDSIPHSHAKKITTIDRLKNFKEVETYSGDMTKHSRRRMKRTIECLYMITKRQRVYNRAINKFTWFRLSHLTLTLSSAQENITDREINKQVLQPFLRDCKRKLGMKEYVWKAEKQKNGNIHYHIISDLFGDIPLIRKFWNNHQNTLKLIDKFDSIHGHNNPNSIDIHYVKTDTALVKYLMKYLGKNEKKDLVIDGKVWDCSSLLKKFKYYSTDLSGSEMTELTNSLKTIQHRQYNSDYFSILQFPNSNYIKSMPAPLQLQHTTQYNDLLNINSSTGIQPNINF